MQVVRIDDMSEAASEYPEFADSARQHGVRSLLSLPLVAGGEGLGALNLYAGVDRGFSDADLSLGVELASTASAVLANSSAYWGALELSEQLSQAMASRALIEQAKGMVMASSPGIGPDEAFAILRQASQRENVKLREVARRIVDRRPFAPGATD
jgi:transcriptional regulator with GAF, ATPase, and Fis domain